MSLRTRLVATLVVLAAGGLVVLAAITYATQRSFQLDRVDAQTQSAVPVVEHDLADAGVRLPGGGLPFGQRGGGGPDRDDRRGPRGRGGPGGPASLLPGTYGELRDATGARIGTPVVLSYGAESLSPPRLPQRLAPGQILTVDAKAGGLKYRVRAQGAPGGAQAVVAIPLNGVDDSLDRLLLVEALVIGGILLLLGLLSWVLVRAGLRPLERMGETAGAIAGGDLSRRVEVSAPGTEVGRLGVALNGMLGRLERAFAEREASEGRLRQFLSDASHELRTPLASIRGYAELYRMGALSSKEEAEGAMRRIEDEGARMGVLVEDLLTLARLDEVSERPAEPVDVAELAYDAVGDARAMDAARAIEARVDGELVVLGDPDGLRQVLANLVRNALVHTPAGTPIEVGARRVGDQAELEVRDHGKGLPDGDPAALFGRFWRTEAGRGRGRAGAGLGLAIVGGIVSAHGGTVTASDAPGGGASFVVRIPLRGGRR